MKTPQGCFDLKLEKKRGQQIDEILQIKKIKTHDRANDKPRLNIKVKKFPLACRLNTFKYLPVKHKATIPLKYIYNLKKFMHFIEDRIVT